LVQDEESEKKWGFQLSTALTTANRIKLLDGYKVFATANVMPSPKEFKGIFSILSLEIIKEI
jgi:hypothetical protein